MRPDQRRPEAVLREMKAKGRGLKAKIEQRMEATRKAGGEKICYTKHLVRAYCSSNSTTNVYPKSRKQG